MKTFQQYLLKFFFISILISPQLLSQILLDTVQHKQVGPGMFYSKYVVHSIPWSIDVLEADMTNQYFAIETAKAFELLAGGREKTSSMAIRGNYVGHWSVGAINEIFLILQPECQTTFKLKMAKRCVTKELITQLLVLTLAMMFQFQSRI